MDHLACEDKLRHTPERTKQRRGGMSRIRAVAERARELLTSRFAMSVCISAVLPLVFYRLVMSYYAVPTSNAMYLIDFLSLAYLSSVFMLVQKNERLAIVPFGYRVGLFQRQTR